MISTVDPQARHTRKTGADKRDGYKAHIPTEPETGLVTECGLTAANAPDGPTGVELLAEEQPGLEVLGDTRYGSGETRAALRAAGPTQTIKPIPLHSTVPSGFTIHDFRIDRQAGKARCPAGAIAPITSSGQASFARHCPGCPLRRRCTTAKRGRTIRLHPHEDELRGARRRAMTRRFQESYRRWRPLVERSIAWLVADGCRRVPYRGIQRNDAWWSLRAAAVNLRRLLVLGLARYDGAWVVACGSWLEQGSDHPGRSRSLAFSYSQRPPSRLATSGAVAETTALTGAGIFSRVLGHAEGTAGEDEPGSGGAGMAAS